MSKAKIRWPSDCRKIKNHVTRRKAYLRAIKKGDLLQDSLESRISAGVELTCDEIEALIALFGHRCHMRTKFELLQALNSVPNIRSYGIYGRVLFTDGCCVSYCAGQDYASEVPFVKRLLIGKA